MVKNIPAYIIRYFFIAAIRLFVTTMTPLFSFSQTFILPGGWWYIQDDKPSYISDTTNSAEWKPVKVPLSLAKQNLNKENFVGWYQLRFSVPDNMLNKTLVLIIGMIDDADETYLNGEKIGSTGKFPPNEQSAWDLERKYVVPRHLLKKNNILSVRIFNGIGDGGIHDGRTLLITKKEYDTQIKHQLKNKTSYYRLTTSNGLIAAVYNQKNHEIEALYPHIFSYYDSAIVVKPVATNFTVNTKEQPLSSGYFKNSHILKIIYPSFELYYYASFIKKNKILYACVKGTTAHISPLDITFKNSHGEVSIHQYQFNNGNQAEKFFLISFSDSLHQHNDTLLSGRQLVRPEEELSYMQNVFSSCHFPSGINTQERNLIEQSIALLMMAQVADNEIFPYAQGQVLASLRPGVWSISWVRDAAFAIEAMSKTGLYKEAKAGLEFMLKAKPVNQFIHYIHTDGKDYGVGVPYIISITRYFGNGREECDYAGNDGPNIELDGLGLFLTALYHYINESGDTEFLKKWLTEIETIANAIVHNITTNKVIRRDSGPWEHHLPGKEYVWTTGVNARGLQLLTILMKHAGMPFKKYEEAYLQLMEGIYKNFVVNNYYIKGNVQDNDPLSQHYFDAASIELFANGLIQDKKLFSTHMKEYNRHLRAVQDDKRGYIRFNSSNSYENQEWPFAGLRVAVAQLKLGNKKEAAKLINRITAFASRNNNQIPEILDNETNIYKGAIPMIGYGAGAYIIAVAEQKKNK